MTKANVTETPKKSLLILAANELNEVMELDPIIKVTGKPKNEYLIKKIIEASSMIDKDDVFSDRTMKVLKMLGVGIEEGVSDKGDEKKPASKKTAKKGKKKDITGVRIDFLAPLIEKGKFTKKELMEQYFSKNPDDSVSGVSTLLTDAKNPKYNKFDDLVILNEKGKYCFE